MKATATRTTTIRPAAAADAPALTVMARRFLETEYGDRVPVINDESLGGLVSAFCGGDNPDVAGFVADVDGVLIGMLGLAISVQPMSGERIAAEIAWWIEPEARGARTALSLLATGEAWARAHGATVLQMIAPNARVQQFYERVGFTHVEAIYQRRLA